MSARTVALHGAFLRALGDFVTSHSDLTIKPFRVDLRLPLPPRLRVYMYSLVVGGSSRMGEYKVVVRVPGQAVGAYGSFDHSGDRLALLVGYRLDLDVFVLWDASLHPRFKNGGNIQVRAATVHRAAAIGCGRETRQLVAGHTEVVLASQSFELAAAIDERVGRTGGSAEERWAISLT